MVIKIDVLKFIFVLAEFSSDVVAYFPSEVQQLKCKLVHVDTSNLL